MPIVLDYSADGAIVGGSFFSHVPNDVVDSGMWQVVLPGAVFARLVHFVDDETPTPGFLRDMGNGQMELVGSGEQGQFRGGDFTLGQRAPQAVMQAGGDEAPNMMRPPIDTRNRVRSPSPPPARAPKRRRVSATRNLEVKLPIAVHIEETSGIASIANTANRSKRKTLRATQTSHVGRVFSTRRALLVRADNPYTCNLCGTGFPHPADAKAHFYGHPDQQDRGCWTKHGQPAGILWDDHPSCKVTEADLNIARCKEGWVIVDQESWDKINAAADEGRKFKERQSAEGAATVGRAQRESDAAGKKKVKSGAKEAVPVERKEPPKRKVVKAGDETETDLGARKK